MSAEIVNLRRVRKTKHKAEAAATAAANRAQFGRSRTERDRQTLDSRRAEHHLDGHRRDRGADPSDGA